MVLSKKLKTVFLVSSEFGEGIAKADHIAGKLNTLASIALNITHAASEFEKVIGSGNDPAIKIGKIGALTASVAAKTLLGIYDGVPHVLAHGLAKSLSAGGMYLHSSNLTNYGSTIDKFDMKAQNIEDMVTNPKNIFEFLNPSLSW
ncbi:MAG: hypothetical protein WCF85_12930 [Rhodospirillaceae bacterium]